MYKRQVWGCCRLGRASTAYQRGLVVTLLAGALGLLLSVAFAYLGNSLLDVYKRQECMFALAYHLTESCEESIN